jgi:outer membrane receptor protein involved in Fe transport
MRLSIEGKLRLAARLAFLAGMGAAAPGAYAEESATAASSPGATQLGGVQVTGTRIKQPGLSSSSPLVTVSDTEVKLQGTINVETLLNSMPQASAGFGENDSNGATGTATVDLRGLGPERTLVLIDGKRLMPGDPLQTPPSADLNFIPAALVDRIDILSGGASAVYGSDAIAGVVNFVMKKDFEGFRIDSQLSRTDHSDGTAWDTTMIWGSNFSSGKGNVTLYAGFTKLEAVTQDKRHYSQNSLSTGCSSYEPGLGCVSGLYDYHYNGGSGTIAEGRIRSAARTAAQGQLFMTDPAGGPGLVPYDGRLFNFAPYNYFQRPTKRWNLGGFAHDEINEHLDIYGSAMFMDNHTLADVAPSGLFGLRVDVPCSGLPGDAQKLFCTDVGKTGADTTTLTFSKRLVEIGPREADIRHDQFRVQFGARGDIVDGITYDTSYQYGQTTTANGTLNYVNSAHVIDALTGCTSGDARCVPLNLYTAGGIDDAQINYIKANGFDQSSQVEQVAGGSVSADLGKYHLTSPLAKNGVGLAGGYEYRTEALTYSPDDNIDQGLLGGSGGPIHAISGSYQVNELFGELQVPIIEDLPGAKLLQIDSAYRYSNYTLAGKAHSYKGGFKYQPTNDLMFRGGFTRATRAPSVNELFTPTSFQLISGSDPCSGASPSASAAQCALTGVSAAQYGSGAIEDCTAGQCYIQSSGNESLKNERSITRSIGIVLTPSLVKNLSLTVDYFDIDVVDAINAKSLSTLFNDCFATGDAASAACQGIHRDADGQIAGDTLTGAGYVADPLVNTGFLRTSGLDFDLEYRLRLRDIGLGNSGSLSWSYVATWLRLFDLESSPGTGTFSCLGRYGSNTDCGVPNPRYRHKFRMTWTSTYGLALSAQWRYFGGVGLASNSSDPHLSSGFIDVPDDKIGAKQYLDLSGTYTLPIKAENVTLRFGVSNVGGQNPPTVDTNSLGVSGPPFGNGNTFPNVYDSLGRVFFVGVTADL